jgi:nitrite reductase (NO-forming)
MRNPNPGRSVKLALGLAALGCALAAAGAGSSAAWAQNVRDFNLSVIEKQVDVGAGMKYAATTYNGTVPGPVLHVRQGDTVRVKLDNGTMSAHGIDIYAAQMAPEKFSGDPHKEVAYEFKAEVPGVFIYHCSAIPVLRHVADGMYGMIVVEPKNGWPNGKAQEIDLVQGELYGTPDPKGLIIGSSRQMIDAQPDFIIFNGQVNRYDVENPIPIKIGELVRIFFLDAGPNLTSVFHVNGAIFSTVYRSGNPADAFTGLPTFEVGPGNSAVFEFRVHEPGRYQFADQSLAHPYKGAVGVFLAK